MLKNASKKGFLLVKIDFAFLPTTFIVYLVLVHCRVGSLENCYFHNECSKIVHCRVGSLENIGTLYRFAFNVHCRVGRFKFFSRYIILTKEIEGHVKYAFLTRLCMF